MFLIRWFENNYMKLNTDQSHLIVSGYKHEQVWVDMGKDLIQKSNDVKLLRITIGYKIDKHVLKLCSKANQKLCALSGMLNCFLSIKEGKCLKFLWNLNLNIVQLLGCFIVDVLTKKLIRYMRGPLELFMRMTSQLLINYFPWKNLSVFTIKIFRDS